MKVNRKIPLDTKYDLPEQTTTVRHAGKILIIAPECCNYIVLGNDAQYGFYQSLKAHTLGDALSMLQTPEEDARAVIVQIEAKRFVEENVAKTNGLFQLHMFLTNACNLRCKHCYMYSGQSKANELSLEEIKSILYSFKDYDGRFVTFSGGEVAMREDLIPILQYTKELGLDTTVMTNGTLWTEAQIKQASGLISAVQISIDGFNEEGNAKVRGKGNFEKSMNTVEQFLHHGIRTTIAMTPWYDEELFRQKEYYMDFEKRMKDKYKGYLLIFKFTADIMQGRELSLNEEEYKRYFNFMKEIADADSADKEEDIFVYNQKNKILKDNWCTFGHLTISADGDIYMCGKVNKTKPICNVRDTSMESIMSLSRKARDLSKVQNLSPCKGCELRYICGAGCRIEYFDWFKDCKGIGGDVPAALLSRKCDASIKQHYYDLMIKANHRLYK